MKRNRGDGNRGVAAGLLVGLAVLAGCESESEIQIGSEGGNDSPSSSTGEPGSYRIVDTGQTMTFDADTAISAPSVAEAFYGQDAQYSGHQPSYSISSDGLTVYDSNTGLTWTRYADWDGDGTVASSDKFTYESAQSYVNTLNSQNYGGYSDWRLPSTKQIFSLVDFRGTDPSSFTTTDGLVPFIDTSVFEFGYGDTAAGERSIDSQWVVSTLYVETVMNGQQAMFGYNFADGRIKGYPTATKTFYARFCRGNESYGQNLFSDNGDGTVTDLATGLTWQQADSGSGMNWQSALAYAENLELGGAADWRLPDAKELHSIVDYARSPGTTGSAAIDAIFAATEIVNEAGQADYPFYWSSTTHKKSSGSGGHAVYIAFGRGMGSMNGGQTAIDVHGAGCQRSDPKDGDASQYPSLGNGPQGDASRVFNYVRCVRGTSN